MYVMIMSLCIFISALTNQNLGIIIVINRNIKVINIKLKIKK